MNVRSPELASHCRAGVVVLCGSMTHFPSMHRVYSQLRGEDVPAELPDAEDEDVTTLDEARYRSFVRRATLAHLRRVASRRTFGILVANFDKHDVDDYIGPSTFAEIATAAGRGKRIFVLNGFPPIYGDHLRAWGAVPLHGRLEPLVALYHRACRTSTDMNQFSLLV